MALISFSLKAFNLSKKKFSKALILINLIYSKISVAHFVLASLQPIEAIIYIIEYLEIIRLTKMVRKITASPARKETPIKLNIMYMAMAI